MKKHGISFFDAKKMVESKRPDINMNEGFESQLKNVFTR